MSRGRPCNRVDLTMPGGRGMVCPERHGRHTHVQPGLSSPRGDRERPQQTYRDFRLIVSDNASTDETSRSSIVHGPSTRLLSGRENIGMIGNFNRLIETCEDPFFMLLPDDDCLFPEYLSSALDVLQRIHGWELCTRHSTRLDIDSRVRRPASRSVDSSTPLDVELAARFSNEA